MNIEKASLSIDELKQELDLRRVQLVDVRSGTEFAAGHVPGAVNIPLDQIESRLDDVNRRADLILICQSGSRASLCREWLAARGLHSSVVEGGTAGWRAAGFGVVSSTRARWSLERQVRLGAGLVILSGLALATFVDPAWLVLCGVAGVGLTVAGLTDFCAMARVLAKMPWNRPVKLA
jgi:rhodanese-related sulfurtransferase